ncbi:hypothetical protein EUGRSUZ_C03231 [Eucalyptus grandis]|uniref:Uncharacterized protein n=2 Tax=Eucalyptus grandis TaxID=71139 RepID=A0ACC3LHT4_EUCGR|nr:hypothetical protein EUGRSUZ_C03231 [Eucalyptus grandis]
MYGASLLPFPSKSLPLSLPWPILIKSITSVTKGARNSQNRINRSINRIPHNIRQSINRQHFPLKQYTTLNAVTDISISKSNRENKNKGSKGSEHANALGGETRLKHLNNQGWLVYTKICDLRRMLGTTTRYVHSGIY